MRLLVFLAGVLAVSMAHYPGDHLPKVGRWCCISDAEMMKCRALVRVALSVTTIPVNVTCVRGINVTDCMSRIHNDNADLVTLGEADIYKADKLHGLVPVVAEDYGLAEEHTSYFAVALVLSSASPSLTMQSLGGKITCHPRAGDVAGWQIPVGFLIERNMMNWRSCSTYQSAGEFFEKSCVPGAFLKENDPHRNNPPSLCGACTRPKCPGDTSERFFGYNGTYTCLVEKKGHVAFVRHTTVFKVTGMNSNLNPGRDFKLLCSDGSRKDVGAYENCNLARIPARVVMTKDLEPEHYRARGYRAFLLELDANLRANVTRFEMYNSSLYGGQDLLFKDSTIRLTDVGDKNTTKKWLGERYLGILRALESCSPDLVKKVSNSNSIGEECCSVTLWSCIMLAGLLNVILTLGFN